MCSPAWAITGPPCGSRRGVPSLVIQPANAIRDALRRDGALTAAALDLVEINEAFVSVSDLVRNPRPCTTGIDNVGLLSPCLLYTSPSPRDGLLSRMPSSA